jgi:hypothetical protein
MIDGRIVYKEEEEDVTVVDWRRDVVDHRSELIRSSRGP